jgi:transposase InsO family protein
MENLLWGAPRIHGELLKLGFSVAQSTVATYMVKRPGPPSQGWRTFLRNHAPDIAAMDLFVVPTIGFKLLYAFVIVRLDRRDLVWINITTSPTAEWVARQITEAFPWAEAPGYMIRDRDRIYGTVVTRRLRAMGIRDKPTAPASPWQNGFAERLIGSIRRECLDHIIVFSEAHLRQILKSYADYYNSVRTHRSLHQDAPISRPIHQTGIIRSHRSSAGFTITTSGFKFSVHTGLRPSAWIWVWSWDPLRFARRHPSHHLSPAWADHPAGPDPEARLSRPKSPQQRSDQKRKPVNSEQDSCSFGQLPNSVSRKLARHFEIFRPVGKHSSHSHLTSIFLSI